MAPKTTQSPISGRNMVVTKAKRSDKTGNWFVNVAITPSEEERSRILTFAALNQASQPAKYAAGDVYALLSGIPDTKLLALRRGDHLVAEHVKLALEINKFVPKESETGDQVIAVGIIASVEGRISRIPRPVAECDWDDAPETRGPDPEAEI